MGVVPFTERRQSGRLEKAGACLEGVFCGACGNGTCPWFIDRELSRMSALVARFVSQRVTGYLKLYQITLG